MSSPLTEPPRDPARPWRLVEDWISQHIVQAQTQSPDPFFQWRVGVEGVRHFRGARAALMGKIAQRRRKTAFDVGRKAGRRGAIVRFDEINLRKIPPAAVGAYFDQGAGHGLRAANKTSGTPTRTAHRLAFRNIHLLNGCPGFRSQQTALENALSQARLRVDALRIGVLR